MQKLAIYLLMLLGISLMGCSHLHSADATTGLTVHKKNPVATVNPSHKDSLLKFWQRLPSLQWFFDDDKWTEAE